MQEPKFSIDGKQYDTPGDYIRQNCQQLGLSISQAAREAKIAPSTLSRICNGKNDPFWVTMNRVRGVFDSYWERQKAG